MTPPAPSPPASRTSMLLSGALLLLVLSSAVLNVLLARELRTTIVDPAPGIAPGTPLPPLSGVAADGRPIEIRYTADARPTVVYFFSPSCEWCERNWANVRALNAATADRYRWIGVSAATTEGLQAFAAARGLDFEIVTDVPAEVLRTYRFVGTPSTLVVDAAGRAVESWVGAFRNGLARRIEAFFDASLPGLAESSRADEPGIR